MLRTSLAQTCRATCTQGAAGRPVMLTHRTLHASAVVHKTMGEKVSDVADKVNKGLGKGLASAIDKGEEATKKAKGTMESMKGEAKAGANKAGSEMERTGSKVKQDANELGSSVKDKAKEAKDAAGR